MCFGLYAIDSRRPANDRLNLLAKKEKLMEMIGCILSEK